MATIYGCQEKIRRYQKLKSDINFIAQNLSYAGNNADNLEREIIIRYFVDDNSTPIASKIRNLHDNLDNTKNFLFNKIIPAIDNAIYLQRQEIVDIERLEKEKREREEREQREKLERFDD